MAAARRAFVLAAVLVVQWPRAGLPSSMGPGSRMVATGVLLVALVGCADRTSEPSTPSPTPPP